MAALIKPHWNIGGLIMGTRADFYVGSGESAEWLGSVAWDGYEWAEDEENDLRRAASEKEYRAAVREILEDRDDATLPDMGWPWPWKSSHTTDYSYTWDGGLKYSIFGHALLPIGAEYTDEQDGVICAKWPEMLPPDNPLHSRSGVIVVSG